MEMTTILRRLQKDAGELGARVTRLQRTIKMRELATGEWLRKVMTAYLLSHPARRRRLALNETAPEKRSARAAALVRRAGALTALGGSGAASATTAAAVTTANSNGLAAPLVYPAAGVAVGADMILRTLAQLRMTCDLGDLHGIHFGPGSERELLGLYALALNLYAHHEEDDPGRELLERVMDAGDGAPTGKLGANLVAETLLRNLMPYIGIFTSAASSYLLTRRIGAFVQRYASFRRALEDEAAPLEERWPEHRRLLIEGLWFIFIADGRLEPLETALLAHLLGTQPQDARQTLLSRFVIDEAEWLSRLGQVQDPEARRLLMKALAVAALEIALPASLWPLLQRAAEALDSEQEEEELEREARERFML